MNQLSAIERAHGLADEFMRGNFEILSARTICDGIKQIMSDVDFDLVKWLEDGVKQMENKWILNSSAREYGITPDELLHRANQLHTASLELNK